MFSPTDFVMESSLLKSPLWQSPFLLTSLSNVCFPLLHPCFVLDFQGKRKHDTVAGSEKKSRTGGTAREQSADDMTIFMERYAIPLKTCIVF